MDRFPPPEASGFALIEVLAALAVLVSGALVLLAASAAISQDVRRAAFELRAIGETREVVRRFRFLDEEERLAGPATGEGRWRQAACPRGESSPGFPTGYRERSLRDVWERWLRDLGCAIPEAEARWRRAPGPGGVAGVEVTVRWPGADGGWEEYRHGAPW